MKQLSFTNLIPDHIELPRFYWDKNLRLKSEIERLMSEEDEKFLYLWGPSDSGKTHLLQTISAELSQDLPSIYLPLKLINSYSAQCLENLEYQHLVIIDDIQAIAQNHEWEHGIFHLFNRIRQQQLTTLIISGDTPPKELGLNLADLSSRLQWGACYQVQEPCDELKLKILMERAQAKGFDLPLQVAQYLLSHSKRQLSKLMTILEQIDIGSLEEQRQKISIPFVKKYLNTSDQDSLT
jgi:DnaA family protein